MTIAYSCVLIMIFFPYLFVILAKTGPRFNNHDPRAYLENITGWRKRAHYVQLNSFETTPAFAVAVIIAHLLKAPQLQLNQIAILFVISRILYAVCYLSDQAALRSLMWGIGMACILGLFYISV